MVKQMSGLEFGPEEVKEAKRWLDSISKEKLIELIIEYSAEGHYPVELFTLASEERSFTVAELKSDWEYLLDQVNQYDNEGNPRAADMLRDAAELVFHQAKRLGRDAAEPLLKQMMEDLQEAEDSTGIGMKWDSEWLYMQVRDAIEEFLNDF